MGRKIKKVLLYMPPVSTSKYAIDVNPLPPLGLAYLGAVLENNGIEVKIFDCLAEGWDSRVEVGDNIVRIGTSFEQVEEIIRDYEPDIVGVNNLFTSQRKNAHEIYKLAKKINSNIVTIAGGAHPTVMPELVLSDANVDFVVLGEGEESLINLIEVVEGRKEIFELNGIGYRANGEKKIIPKTKFIEDLDGLPFPARHLLNMKKYFGLKVSHGTRTKKRFSPIITSRGCPTGCTFCSAHKVWGKKFRSRSAENVIAEMKLIKQEYGIEEIMFEDDNMNLNAKRAEKIFDLMIKEKLDFVWDTPNGVAAWTLTENIIRKMKLSGCRKLNFPIETGNQFVMDNIIRKPVKLHKIAPLINYAHKINLKVGIFLVIGMPGETEKQMWDSVHFAKDLGVYSPHISIATPYPGSELYEICLEKKYLRDNFTLDDLFIRSFPISTKSWSSERLKEIYGDIQRFLFISYFKKHSLQFTTTIVKKFLRNPVKFLKQVFKFVLGKKDWNIVR